MIGFPILTLLLIGHSNGQMCEEGQTNFTITELQEEVIVKKNRTTVEDYPVVNCCPGYINDNNVCIPGCPAGTHGENCTLNCTCPGFCYKYSGLCICHPGFQGTNCTEACTPDTYGINCQQMCRCRNNSTCNATDGSCTCSNPGWQGTLCDEECTNNTYGLFCNATCTCNENQTCDHVDGSCACKPGWMGTTCAEECNGTTFGVDCLQDCTCISTRTKNCDRVTGSCYCNPGYTDRDCGQECRPGWYGQDCARNCSEQCSNTDYCDHVNGSCICLGTQGPNCTQECDVGQYGPNCDWSCNCSNSVNQSCHSITGQCLCSAGWSGQKCDQECSFGSFGVNCSSNCSDVCIGTDHCDPVNGTCICIHRTGKNCSEECGPKLYGYDCKEECPCNHTNSNGSCDRNGTCFCHDGWKGSTCEIEMDQSDATTSNVLKGSESFFEQNMLYIILGPLAVLVVVLVILGAIYRHRKTLNNRLKAKQDSWVSHVQDNPSYDSSIKDTAQIKSSSTDSKTHMYEDAVLEMETKTELTRNEVSHVDNISEDTECTHLMENGTRACVETNMYPDNTEDDYSVPDKDTDTKKHTNEEEHLKEGGTPNLEEEVYDSTQDNVLTTENVPNEYNTFQDVIKIQQEAGRKESETEEDYDTICRTESHKMKPEDHEQYSSFEQVRKLSRQDSIDEEDTYNALNEHLNEHRSALVNDSRYHHISLKDKTVDGETFSMVSPSVRLSTQRQLSSGNKLPKQRSLQDSDVISEEPEEVHGANNNITSNSNADGILEEDTEVIYDECDIDDVIEDHKSEKSKLLSESGVDQDSKPPNITEIVYEECDEPADEQSRPPSAVVYEDVDEEEDSKNDNEDENGEEKQEPPQDKLRPHVKRSVDRRREDYEDFAL